MKSKQVQYFLIATFQKIVSKTEDYVWSSFIYEYIKKKHKENPSSFRICSVLVQSFCQSWSYSLGILTCIQVLFVLCPHLQIKVKLLLGSLLACFSLDFGPNPLFRILCSLILGRIACLLKIFGLRLPSTLYSPIYAMSFFALHPQSLRHCQKLFLNRS